MIGVVSASNLLVQFPINDWLTYGAFSYPVSFLISELTTRMHGAKQARKVVYVGFIVGVLFSFVLATPRIAIASGTAFLISQLLDITIFSRLRKTGNWWMAPLCASIFASAIDTFIFWTVAFWGEDLPFVTWALGDMGVKICADLLMLLPFRLMLNRLAMKKEIFAN
jgi:uncharacterized PurR-regulated membrane protein YhhQ (DUF165 family)